MSQKATPLKLEDGSEIELYSITIRKKSRIYTVVEDKNEPMTDGIQDSVFIQDYSKGLCER
ncbi:MAG TPA: hypothetical protein VFI73_14595 [Candidatus Nitrosopolaris sp.]|nr:hypothetical protein [Candidatus Nitrosopolaris sp.]